MTSGNDGGKEIAHQVEIGIQHVPPGADIGRLVSLYGEQPELLASAGGFENHDEVGEVKITVQRTHEWETMITLTALGAGTFATAVLKTLGESTGRWIADALQKEDPPSVRLKLENDSGIEISPEVAEDTEVVVEKFKKAREKDGKLIIEFR